jgi:hypothetical protein
MTGDLERLSKTRKNICQNNQYPGWDLNQEPLETDSSELSACQPILTETLRWSWGSSWNIQSSDYEFFLEMLWQNIMNHLLKNLMPTKSWIQIVFKMNFLCPYLNFFFSKKWALLIISMGNTSIKKYPWYSSVTRGKWSSGILANYCWTLATDAPHMQYKHKATAISEVTSTSNFLDTPLSQSKFHFWNTQHWW